jgi:RNA polymerase sigma factor (sigma-70 family)
MTNMSFDPAGSVTGFFGQLRQGDRAAAEELWRRYFPRLLGLARRMPGGFPSRAADAEDAVQSAMASFFQRAERGDFGDELDRDNLWGLLGTITVRKVRKQARRERAQKRGGGRVRSESALGGAADEPFRLDQTVSEMPTADFDLECEELLLMLDDDQRQIALLRLAGYGTAEIAQALGCTQRRVQRKLNLVRLRWEQELGE